VICTFNAYVFLLFELMLPKMMAFQGHWNHQCILYKCDQNTTMV
jgi:hypothetical protein